MATGKVKNRRVQAAILSQWVLTVGTLVAIGWIIWSHREAFGRVVTIGSGTFALMSLSVVTSFLVNGVEMRVLIRKFGPQHPDA